MVFFHVVHNLLKRLLLLNVHAIADLFFVLPIVDHRSYWRTGRLKLLGVILGLFGLSWLMWYVQVNEEILRRADLTAVEDLRLGD